jgi:hypothetical protein
MKYAIAVISLVILAYLIVDFNSRSAALQTLEAERQVVEARLASRTATVGALQEQIAYATSQAAVVEWAYQNHMAKPGDNVIVPVHPVQVTPTPAPRPVVAAEQPSNFEMWLRLFFGPKD